MHLDRCERMKSSKGVEYEGFDRIYHVVPSFSWHQFILFCMVSSCTILSGMVSSKNLNPEDKEITMKHLGSNGISVFKCETREIEMQKWVWSLSK